MPAIKQSPKAVSSKAPQAPKAKAPSLKVPPSPAPTRDSALVSAEAKRPEASAKALPNLGSWGGVADTPQGDPHFKYDPVEVKDHTAAQYWTPGSNVPSGVEANQEITAGYHDLNQEMQSYLGGDPEKPLPAVADWSTFAKYASGGEVLKETRLLENMTKALDGDPAAAAKMAVEGTQGDIPMQGALLGSQLAAEGAQKQHPLEYLSPVGVSSDILTDVAGEGVGTAFRMRDALVKGNTEIWRDVAPAYDAFLQGESDGGKGMEKLKEAGYHKGSEKDPHGLIAAGFGDYKTARELGLKAQDLDPKSQEYKDLVAQRQGLVEGGNLKLVAQEQLMLESDEIYGDPTVKKTIDRTSSAMSMQDANGKYKLLENGGTWTDFETRMGVKKTDSEADGAFSFPDENGKMNHYAVDPKAKGTISHYFKQNSAGPRAENLIRNEPDTSEPVPKSQTGKTVIKAGEALRDGDLGGAAGQGAALAPKVASDLADIAGDALYDSADRSYDEGFGQIERGRRRGGLGGALEQVDGAGKVLAGGVKEVASDVAEGAADVLSDAGDVVAETVESGVDHVEDVVKSYDKGVVMPWDKNAKWWIFDNPFS